MVPDGPKAEASWDVKITISRNGFPTFPLMVSCCHHIQMNMTHYRAASVSQKRVRSVVMNLFSASMARSLQLNSLVRPSGSCFSGLSIDLLSSSRGDSRSHPKPETEFIVIEIIVSGSQLVSVRIFQLTSKGRGYIWSDSYEMLKPICVLDIESETQLSA